MPYYMIKKDKMSTPNAAGEEKHPRGCPLSVQNQNGASFIPGFHVYVDTCEPPAISKLFQLKLAGALAIHPAC